LTDDLFIATIGNYSSSLGSTLILPGETEPTTKRYKRINGLTIATGSRVLVARVSGTYVIIGRIV
jgi:hypothetical protein